MELLFATSNANKVIGPARALAPLGIEVVQFKIDLAEIQSDDVGVIAGDKARQAFAAAQRPIFTADTAFHINDLGGFPGPMVKWTTNQIGLDGYLRLMAHRLLPEERACHFEDALALAYAADRDPELFRRRVDGRLATEIRGPSRPGQTSQLWRLFIPDGWDKTLAEMTDEELVRYRSTVAETYRYIALWFRSRKF